MSKFLFVVNRSENWPFATAGATVVTAREYLTNRKYASMRGVRVVNLCRTLAYQTNGYYVSLLAEARGHKPLPRITTIQDLKSVPFVRSASSDLDELVEKTLTNVRNDTFELQIFFSRGIHKDYHQLCRQIFNIFPAPLLRATFRREKDGWALQTVSPIAIADISEEMRVILSERAENFIENGMTPTRPKRGRFDMAILWDENERNSASNEKAIQKFIRAAEKKSIDAEIIDRDDIGRIGEFDALFIRATTAVNNYTYRFARRAEAEGLVVMDDAASIVRCSNKVYLAELFERHEIPTPLTRIVHRDNIEEVLKEIGLPIVLKQPDSSFSVGVIKTKTADEYRREVLEMINKSDLVIAQKYLPTSFDWRIGILDQKPLYACKYYMARGHWQIYIPGESAMSKGTGRHETFPVEMAPRNVVRLALKAANLIGRGLYGVDVKVVEGKPYIVEVNDNPSIDSGVEDMVLRETLYERVIDFFMRQLERISDGLE